MWVHWHVVAMQEDGTGEFVGRYDSLETAEVAAYAYAGAMTEHGWTGEQNAYGVVLTRGAETMQLGFTSCRDADCV